MLEGLFLEIEKKTWDMDYLASEFWHPERYGINIERHKHPEKILSKGLGKKYDFIITTDCWFKRIRRVLDYLRKEGHKIILISREPVVPMMHCRNMFYCKSYLVNGEYYFNPDLVLAAGSEYVEFWKDKTKCDIVGYPRFEQYLSKFEPPDIIKEKYGLAKDKKIILFPSFQPSYYKWDGKKEIYLDLSKDHENIMLALEDVSKDMGKKQVVVKIHPMSQKNYNAGIKQYHDVAGTLKKYYKNPSEKLMVIKDIREKGNIIKELIYVSDVVVGFGTTTLLEAVILKKPVINLLFGGIGKEQGLLKYDEEMPCAYNRDNLTNMLFHSNSIKTIKNSKLVEKYLYKIDGKFCERMCEAIKNYLGRS